MCGGLKRSVEHVTAWTTTALQTSLRKRTTVLADGEEASDAVFVESVDDCVSIDICLLGCYTARPHAFPAIECSCQPRCEKRALVNIQ